MKKCTKCGIEKYLTEFYKDCRKENDYLSSCKQCHKVYRKSYNGSQKFRETRKRYFTEGRIKPLFGEEVKTPKEYKARYNLYYKESGKQKEYIRNRMLIDEQFRINMTFRARFGEAFRDNYKKGYVVDVIGCTIHELKKHLESQFKEGMSWENYGIKGWTIDHIIPISNVDLTDKAQFLMVMNYKNMQPLWAKENRLKSNN